MPMYDKPLTRKKDGTFERWLGVDEKKTKQVFRMPAEISQEEAERRWRQIAALWAQIESSVVPPDAPQELTALWSAKWDENRLAMAKAIAKGDEALLEREVCESSLSYVRRIAETQDYLGTEIVPVDIASYERGLDQLRRLIAVKNERLGKLLGKPGLQLTGVTLRQAFEAYRKEIDAKKTFRTVDGKRKPWLKTQLDNLDSMTGFYLVPYLDLDLGELTKCQCEEIIELFASRPLTQRGRPMRLSFARHLIKQFRSFLRWLDGDERFPWDMPKKLDLRKPIVYRKADSEERIQTRKENVTISVDDLKLIAEYATPLERLYFFLALNCAYGADQLGRLRTEWLDLDGAKIDGERLKVESISRHWLWAISVEGLRWYLSKHERKGLVFIATSGKPVYHETENGNVIDGFANRWNNLIARIKKDKPEFPAYSFGKLRKTAATEILRVADPHIASMLLAHKTISEDELLRRYANLPWDRLFEAQRRLESEFALVFQAAGADPFGNKAKTYIGLEKKKGIFELDQAGLSAAQIAEQLGISTTTVFRHLQSKYGKRKSGRKSANTSQHVPNDQPGSTDPANEGEAGSPSATA